MRRLHGGAGASAGAAAAGPWRPPLMASRRGGADRIRWPRAAGSAAPAARIHAAATATTGTAAAMAPTGPGDGSSSGLPAGLNYEFSYIIFLNLDPFLVRILIHLELRPVKIVAKKNM